MKMRVVDQLHVSSVGPNTMAKGAEFEISDDLGRSLAERGLAAPVGAAEKAEPAPSNKAEPAPANKSGGVQDDGGEQHQATQAGEPTRGKRGNKR